jgi:hypothetical protein
MAYYQENEDELNGQGQAPSGPVQTGPSTSGIITGEGGSSSPNAPTPDRGSNFVGLKSYLDANKTQAGKLGDQTAGVISNSANDARSSISGLNDAFNTQAGAPVSLNSQALNKIPQAETLSDDEKSNLKTAYNANYSGPSALTDLTGQYTEAQGKLNKARQTVDAAGTEQGRQTLVSQINDKPRTQGITNFDNILLSAGGGREKVQGAAEANKDVKDDVLGQANIAAQQKASDIKSQNDAVRAQTQSAVTGASEQFNTSLQQKLQDAIAKITGKNQNVVTDIADLGQVYEDTADIFGLNAGEALYGADLNNYLTQADPTAVNAGNVADQTDYARYLALSELSGGTPSLLKQENIGQAGTAQNMGPTAKYQDLRSYLGSKGAEFERAMTTGNDGQANGYLNPDDFQASGVEIGPGVDLPSFLQQAMLRQGDESGMNIKAMSPQQILDTVVPWFQERGRQSSGGANPELYKYNSDIAKGLLKSLETFKKKYGADQLVPKLAKRE